MYAIKKRKILYYKNTTQKSISLMHIKYTIMMSGDSEFEDSMC